MSLAEQFAEDEAKLGVKFTEDQKELMKEYYVSDENIEDISDEDFKETLSKLEKLTK